MVDTIKQVKLIAFLSAALILVVVMMLTQYMQHFTSSVCKITIKINLSSKLKVFFFFF